ncbi:MAG: AAA family ATPase [Candidatus Omnitrophota bacterium]
MYEHFFKLTDKPFSVTPDTKFFFEAEHHKEALNSLIYAISERKGFAVITGEIGAGKTTTWHALLNHLDSQTKIALITNTHTTPKQMITAILDDLDVPFSQRSTKIKLLTELNGYLLKQASLGCNVVVVIDEAQNLSVQSLEEVRMLSNLETEKEKLLQIILLGQPRLRQVLAQDVLTQLTQRIAVYYHIKPLTKDESLGYINHRLKVAGANGNVIFSGEALNKIYIGSEGIPRRINTICDRAMLTGFIREKDLIDEGIVDEVIEEFEGITKNNA